MALASAAPLLSVAIAFILLELILPLFDTRYRVLFQQDVAPIANLDEARRFIESPAFDADLGWDRNPIARNARPSISYFAQAYGDSFVECAVPDNDTWEAHFETLTGTPILNLGVGGYGLDQAVLKFEKYGARFDAPFAILGLYNQTYRRALSYSSYYYFKNNEEFAYLFKPIFIPSDVSYALISPPCRDAECLYGALMGGNKAVEQIRERHDYWYQLNLREPAARFPRTYAYARMLPFLLESRRERRGDRNYFFVNRHSFELTKYLIRRFREHSRRVNAVPVFVLLYSPSDLAVIALGHRLDAELITFLKDEGLRYVDTATYILDRHPNEPTFASLAIPDGHLNSAGNLLVAEAIARDLGPEIPVSLGPHGHQ